MQRTMGATSALALTFLAGAANAAGTPPSAPALDYSSASNWVCRPGFVKCEFDLRTTVIDASGRRRLEMFRPTSRPKADCFYVYPTVSTSSGFTATLPVTKRELSAVRQQAARLTATCRLFVPFYRQVTYTSMRSGFVAPRHETEVAEDRQADDDVLAAWDYYLAHDNGGRPFVLIGHSQGAIRLIRLIQKRIDGKSNQRRMLSAILPGAFVLTPTGKSVGGTFKSIPPCRHDGQTGCFLAFNSMRAGTVLPDNLKSSFHGQREVCTNPAALAGGLGKLKAYLSTSGETIIPELTGKQSPWTLDDRPVPTPFVRLPHFYYAECRVDSHGSFLIVYEHRQTDDVRTGHMSGDWMVDGKAVPELGLHLIDLNLVAGNLIDVVRGQLRAWSIRQSGR